MHRRHRVRLKASFDETGITGPALVVIKAMKKYGLILADNGSNWFISHGSDFEIVKTGNPIVPQPE